jgi:cellulose 1,4-beta-cellobiosidase
MLWLDSTYPVDSTSAGAKRGTCATTSGVPSDVEANNADSSVNYSNIKFGPIGSTFSETGTGSSGSSTTTTAASSSTTTASSGSSGTVAQYAQCGGTGWTGATACVSGYTCTSLNTYYSQCL